MNSKDLDKEKLAEMLDRALQSDTPQVQDALRQLLMLTALYESGKPVKNGIIGKLILDVTNLENKLEHLIRILDRSLPPSELDRIHRNLYSDRSFYDPHWKNHIL